MAASDPIRVQHWDELEDKVLAKNDSPRVVWTKDEVEESVEYKAGWGFTRMDPAG